MNASGSDAGSNGDTCGRDVPQRSRIRRLIRIVVPWRWPIVALPLVFFFYMGHLAGAVQKEQEILRAKAIVAEGYELQGSDGKKYASLSVVNGSEPRLSFFDKDGRMRIELGMLENGQPSLGLCDESGKFRAIIGMHSSGSSMFSLLDENGKPSAGFHVSKDGSTAMHVGRTGQAQIRIEVSAEGLPRIILNDPQGRPKIGLEVAKGQPYVGLYGDQGVVRSSWSLVADSSPELALRDSKSQVRLTISTDKNGEPSIQFLASDGRVVKKVTMDSK